jgi:hypothetical protein
MALVWRPDELPSCCSVHELTPSVGDSDLASGRCLPIERDSWQIREAIRENTVVAIKAETASGKTMQGPQYLRQEVQFWPVLIVQKSCFAADLVVNSLVEAFDLDRRHLHLRSGLHDQDAFSRATTQYSVITYGILWEWLRT